MNEKKLLKTIDYIADFYCDKFLGSPSQNIPTANEAAQAKQQIAKIIQAHFENQPKVSFILAVEKKDE